MELHKIVRGTSRRTEILYEYRNGTFELLDGKLTDKNGTVYGYDVDNNLFKLNQETYEREIIAALDSEALIVDVLVSAGQNEADAIAMLKPGVPAADIAKFHIENVTKMGYGDWF